MRSRIIVISWWSNTLGLACLHGLVRRSRVRQVSVLQAGKSEEQKLRFRHYLPKRVSELDYPQDQPDVQGCMIRDLVLRQLPHEEGIWFIEQAVFIHSELEHWLRAADAWLSQTDQCLCLPSRPGSIPAVWVSPARWPADFDPGHFQFFLDLPGGSPAHPAGEQKIYAAWEGLSHSGRVGYFPLSKQEAVGMKLPPFPSHTQMSGLSLFDGSHFASPHKGDSPGEWEQGVIHRFSSFFEACPPEWLTIENQALLDRLCRFQGEWNEG